MHRLASAVAALALASTGYARASAITVGAVYQANQIGTPLEIGASVGTTTTNNSAAIGNLLPSGSLLLDIIGVASGAINSVTTGAGSPAAGTAVSTPASNVVRPFYLYTGADINPGDTVGAVIGSNVVSGQAVYGVTGVATSPLDIQGAGTSGTGTTPSISTGTLSSANEIVIGFFLVTGGQNDTFTEAPGFTTIGGVAVGAAAIGRIRVAYKIVNSTAPVTYAPVLGTSRGYVANVITFRGQ